MREGTAAAALELVSAASRAASRRALRFHMLNRTVLAVPYDRASLWRYRGSPKLLGVSGVDVPDPKAPFAMAWREMIRRGGLGAEPAALPLPASPAPSAAALRAWEAVAKTAPGVRAAWQPLPGTGLALCLERWGTDFAPAELEIAARLADGYALAWFGPSRREPGRFFRFFLRAALLAAIAAALAWIEAPLRIVAPCEVIARSPVLVAAPADGVIREVLVEQGRAVRAGEVVAEYERITAVEELEVARREVEVVTEQLAGARSRSFSEPRLRSEAAQLEARLEQEKARMAMAEARLARLTVAAPAAGLVQIEDPTAWRGRPVMTGERILWVVDPADSLVRVWLPQSDRIDFDFSRPASVHLNAYGGGLLPARLTKVGTMAQAAPDGSQAFAARAEWLDGAEADGLLGLSGTAVLYGPPVPLGYWLFRKPLAGVRQWLGL